MLFNIVVRGMRWLCYKMCEYIYNKVWDMYMEGGGKEGKKERV
jgi:hypothetical protein